MASILLVEDDGSMRNFLAMALEKAGHTVTTKGDGLDALRALDEPDARYDLLLTDIVMPGMDGIELSRKAQEKKPDMKVMFITGFAAVSMEEHRNAQNNAHVLSKPFHLNELVEQIDTILSG